MSTPDARDLLRALVPIDRCVAVWCAAQCARTALRYVPEGGQRPLQAIEAAEAWAREPTKERKKAAASAASAANAAYAAAANAANAAYAAYAASAAASAAANAAYAAREQALSDLHALCLGQRWPLTPAPTARVRRTLPEEQQVAWDALDEADLPGELTVEQLVEAHTHRGALSWEGADRALAERIVLLPRARVLAAGGGW